MKFIIKILIILLLITTTSACAEQTKEEVKQSPEQTKTTYHFSHNGRDFEIYYFFDEVLSYTKLMNEDPKLDNKEIFRHTVLEPFMKESAIYHQNLGNFFSPTTKIVKLKENTNELLKKQDKISQWIKKSIEKSTELLPGRDTTFYVFPVNPDDWFTVYKMEGIGGAAFFGNKILLMLDPAFEEEMLKYTVAHEYNHTVHMSHNGTKSMSTILDGVITEGKADNFAKILYPTMKVPWIESLTEDEENAVLEELTKIDDSAYFNGYNDFLYGKSSNNIPQWANYKIGYQVTKSFIEHNPDISIPEWTKMDATQIVKNSDYKMLVE